ncbi:MAG: NUDIX domain-containing protein [Myxococcales bacterium]|nr:MAG: NUDIX domain-containing protein [Myxococcales bacterium]
MELLAQGQKSLYRDCFSPGHFTVSTFVFNDDAELLVLFHPKLKKWLQPGGHMERRDRSILAAALRELEEETALAASSVRPLHESFFDVDIHAIPAFGHEPAHQHFDLRYAFVLQDAEARIEKNLKWMDAKAIAQHSDLSVQNSQKKSSTIFLENLRSVHLPTESMVRLALISNSKPPRGYCSEAIKTNNCGRLKAFAVLLFIFVRHMQTLRNNTPAEANDW